MSGFGAQHPKESFLAEKMKNAQQGDAQAYRELLWEVRAILMRYAGQVLRRMGIEDPMVCEDLTQEVMLAIHQKRATYDPAQLFTPWLFAIARYKLIDFGRQKRRDFKLIIDGNDSDREPFADLGFEQNPDPSESMGVDSDLGLLLSRLPEKQRTMVEWVKIQGVSIAEVSAKMGMSESAVKVSVHRALESLKEQVKLEGEKGGSAHERKEGS